jgi:hypothetical protein
LTVGPITMSGADFGVTGGRLVFKGRGRVGAASGIFCHVVVAL